MIRITESNKDILKPGMLIKYIGHKWGMWEGAIYKFYSFKYINSQPSIVKIKINTIGGQLEPPGTLTLLELRVCYEQGLYIISSGKPYKKKDLL